MRVSRICLTGMLAGVVALNAEAVFAQAGEVISLTVDASRTPQKLLHADLVLPVKPGPLTLYYPKWIPGEHGPDGPIGNLTGLHFKADGKEVPWKRDQLDMFAFHVDVPAGATHLQAAYDYIESAGASATDKLIAFEWNEAMLYPAGTSSDKLMYEAKLKLPEGWKYGTSLPVESASGNEIKFKPISLELLVDSPVIAGEYYRVVDLTPPGETVHHELDLVADSEAALAISPEVQKGLTNVVAESGKLFGARQIGRAHV